MFPTGIDEWDSDERARLLAFHLNLFPNLRQCWVVSADLESPCDDEIYFFQQVGYHSDPTYHPISTILIWDVLNGRTSAVPLVPFKRYADFGRLNVGRANGFVLQNSDGKAHFGCYQQLVWLAKQTCKSMWRRTSENIVVPSDLCATLDFVDAAELTRAEVLSGLGRENYGLDFYLRAMLKQPWSVPGLANRVEVYTDRDAQQHVAPSRRYVSLCMEEYNREKGSGHKLRPADLCPWIKDQYGVRLEDSSDEEQP